MDFSYLMELAKTNAQEQKPSAHKFSTSLSKPKKVERTAPNVDAIKSFLDKKELEKKKKQEDFVRKRQELLTLRAQDKKSKKRVSAMINRTKGASKSVLEDAKDITEAKGEEQCDADDYGYESELSQAIFKKLQKKYQELPEDERLKFHKTAKANISDIKDRVISSLKKEEEEEMGPRKRKRKSQKKEDVDDFINDGDEYAKFESIRDPEPRDSDNCDEKAARNEEKSSKHSVSKIPTNLNVTIYKSDKYSNFKYDDGKKDSKDSNDRMKEKKIKKKTAAPPLSFMELLKLAESKKVDPLEVLEKPLKKEKDKVPDERPLTAKEKQELEEERLRKLKRMGKAKAEECREHKNTKLTVSEDDQNRVNVNKSKLKEKLMEKQRPSQPSVKDFKEKHKEKPLQVPVKAADKSKYHTQDNSTVNSSLKLLRKAGNPPVKVSTVDRPSCQVSKVTLGSATKSSKGLPIPKPSRPQAAPSVHSIHKQTVQKTIAPSTKRSRIESDDEYDSEMDDFIDDGEENLDYSSEIRRMFGYDKSKYRDDDGDDSDMEASFHQVEKEEKISAKIGLIEDLEDMRKEEERKNRKLKLKKVMKNR